jgi:hypothetical protein
MTTVDCELKERVGANGVGTGDWRDRDSSALCEHLWDQSPKHNRANPIGRDSGRYPGATDLQRCALGAQVAHKKELREQ